MFAPLKVVLAVALSAGLAAGFSAEASAKKKSRSKHPESSHIVRDYDGTPIIMQGYRPRRPGPAEEGTTREYADRPVHIPRGSSTYIPPPVPSPYSPNSPPAAALTQPAVQPYNPPPITTFSDRVTGAIHAYPLERGIGNNPTDQQTFIRQRANQ